MFIIFCSIIKFFIVAVLYVATVLNYCVDFSVNSLVVVESAHE